MNMLLTYNGTPVRLINDQLNMTDMWKASGSPANQEPWNWSRKEGAQFIEFIAESHNLTVGQVMKSKPGKNGGTVAHWQIGLAYAKYLSPEFHAWCNVAVRDRMEGVFSAANPEDLRIKAQKSETASLNALTRTLGEVRRTMGIRAAAKVAPALLAKIGVTVAAEDSNTLDQGELDFPANGESRP